MVSRVGYVISYSILDQDVHAQCIPLNIVTIPNIQDMPDV